MPSRATVSSLLPVVWLDSLEFRSEPVTGLSPEFLFLSFSYYYHHSPLHLFQLYFPSPLLDIRVVFLLLLLFSLYVFLSVIFIIVLSVKKQKQKKIFYLYPFYPACACTSRRLCDRGWCPYIGISVCGQKKNLNRI